LRKAPDFREVVLLTARSLLAGFKSRLRKTRRVKSSKPTSLEADQSEKLVRAQEKIAEKNQRLERMRKRLAIKDREIAELRAKLHESVGEAPGIRSENLIWIFGHGRSGSTWLSQMMEDLEDHALWHEPLVGHLFGNLYYSRAGEGHRRNKNFILGWHRETWLRSIWSFVLEGANARFPEVAGGGYLVIKEPNGSIGAPLLMEAMPESRMIFLIRDPRDVVASSIDAVRKGSWRYERKRQTLEGRRDEVSFDTEIEREASVGEQADAYMQNIENAKQAYEEHEGPKVLVKYEELRADTLATMRRIYSELGIPLEEGELLRTVEKHAWERIPEEEKGRGKFYRKAAPGGWREDLTPEQVEIVESIAAPVLEEFYPS
jgi:hypothetical protein